MLAFSLEDERQFVEVVEVVEDRDQMLADAEAHEFAGLHEGIRGERETR